MCDTLCVVRGDRTLFAKNSDRPPGEMQVFERHARRPAGGRLRTQYLEIADAGAGAVVGSRPTWLWGFEHGVSEHRVAIGNERVWTTDPEREQPPALIGMDLVRLGLERGRSAADALDAMTDLLGRHGQGGSCDEHHDDPYFSSFLVADPEEAWILETSARTWAARRVEDAAAISNRLTIGTDWTRSSPDVGAGSDFSARNAPTGPAISDHRLAVTRAAVATASAALGPGEVVATLRHHGERAWGAPGANPADVAPLPSDVGDDLHGITVCQHVRGAFATTASIVAELPGDAGAPIRLWVALGSPCASVYVPAAVDAVAPELSNPATWQRFARLARRVEDDADALAAVRAVLAPVEADLWDAADAQFATGDDHRAFCEAAFAPVAAALARLGV